MTKSDHDALVHIGKQMAASNGYRPQQASDLYITSGTSRDFAYGVYRIYSYTFELSNGDYLDDSRIASETGRNKNAVLYLAERAWCPLSVLGASMRFARCGVFDDDFEVAPRLDRRTPTAPTRRRAACSCAPTRQRPSRRATSSSGRPVRLAGARDRRRRAGPRPTPTTSTGGRRSARPRSSSRRSAGRTCSSATCSRTGRMRRRPIDSSRASRTPAASARRS